MKCGWLAGWRWWRGTLGWVLVVTAIGYAALDRRPSATDPRVRGRLVSQWFGELVSVGAYFPEAGTPHFGMYGDGRLSTRSRLRAEEAYRALMVAGTNALPFLIREAIEGGSRTGMGRALEALVERLPGRLGRRVPPDAAPQLATELIGRLRPSGSLLLEGVEPWLAATDPRPRGRAIALLAASGSEEAKVAERMREILASGDITVEVPATYVLARLGSASTNAVGELTTLVGAWKRYEGWVFFALAHAGEAASAAVPALETVMTDGRPDAAIAAALALCRIQPEHGQAWPWLWSIAEGKAEESEGRRVKAGQLLRQLAELRVPEVRLGRLARRVLERQTKRWSTDGQAALSVLNRLDPGAAEAVVRGWMEHPLHEGEPVHAARWLLRYRPELEYPRERLLTLAERSSPEWLRFLAVSALVEAPRLTSREKAAIRSVCESSGLASGLREEAGVVLERLRWRETEGETEVGPRR